MKFHLSKESLIKILNILSLILLIACVGAAVFVYLKTEDYSVKEKSLTKHLKTTANIIDRKSGTNLSSAQYLLNNNKISEFENYQSKYKNTLSSIMNQRNSLAGELSNISKEVSPTPISPDSFEHIAKYGSSTIQLNKDVNQTSQLLDNILDKTIVFSSKHDIKIPNIRTFKEGTAPSSEYTDVFEQISRKLVKLNKDLDDKSVQLAEKSKELQQLEKDFLNHKNLADNLQDTVDGSTSINNKLREEVKKLTTQLNSTNVKVKKLLEEKKNLGVISNNTMKYFQKITGKVINTNPEWNYALVNLGSNLKVTVKDSDGKNKQVAVPMQPGYKLVVSRNDEFVASLKVTKVFAEYSAAEVAFPSDATIKTGDIVFPVKE